MDKGRFGKTIFAAFLILLSAPVLAQMSSRAHVINIVYMGGNDCGPCVAWRASELPKLQQSEEFKAVIFTHVTKTINSAVPPSFFLPPNVRQFKDKLDAASGNRYGSPQTAILVDGEVFDYFYGTRTADEFISMLSAIRSNSKYPFDRCVKRGDALYSCEVKGN